MSFSKMHNINQWKSFGMTTMSLKKESETEFKVREYDPPAMNVEKFSTQLANNDLV